MSKMIIEKKETLVSILKKLSQEEREIIEIIIPEYALIAKNSLGLKILKKEANKKNKKISITTKDKVITKLAEKAGIPVSKKNSLKLVVSDIETKKDGENVQDQGEKSEEISEEVQNVKEEKKIEKVIQLDKIQKEIKPDKTNDAKVVVQKRSRSFKKIAFIFIFICFLFISGIAMAAYFFLPKAQVQIILSGKEVSNEIKVTADVGAIDANIETKTIPGTVITISESGEKQTDTTGKKETGEKATGQVVIQNLSSNQTIFPAGTVFTVYTGQTGEGLKFFSDQVSTVPAASVTIEEGDEGSLREVREAGTVSVAVTAEKFGGKYNVEAKTNFSVGTEVYSIFKAVNQKAFKGGSSKEVSIVAQADLTNLHAILVSDLYKKGKADLENTITEDQRLVDKTISHQILSEIYDKVVGDEAKKVALNLKTESKATVYSDSQLKQIAGDSISSLVPKDYYFENKDIVVTPELSSTEENGNLVLLVKTQVVSYPLLDTNSVRDALKGIKPREAESYLKGMEKVLGYNISVWPPLPEKLRRMPMVDSRLVVNTTIEQEKKK